MTFHIAKINAKSPLENVVYLTETFLHKESKEQKKSKLSIEFLFK